MLLPSQERTCTCKWAGVCAILRQRISVEKILRMANSGRAPGRIWWPCSCKWRWLLNLSHTMLNEARHANVRWHFLCLLITAWQHRILYQATSNHFGSTCAKAIRKELDVTRTRPLAKTTRSDLSDDVLLQRFDSHDFPNHPVQALHRSSKAHHLPDFELIKRWRFELLVLFFLQEDRLRLFNSHFNSLFQHERVWPGVAQKNP